LLGLSKALRFAGVESDRQEALARARFLLTVSVQGDIIDDDAPSLLTVVVTTEEVRGVRGSERPARGLISRARQVPNPAGSLRGPQPFRLPVGFVRDAKVNGAGR